MNIVSYLNPIAWFWRVYYGFDFFISYAHEDARIYAKALHEELSSSGFRCFLDSAELQVGERLTGTLTRTLQRSQLLVVLHSPAANRSDWVAQEVVLFESTGRRIIAVDLQNGTSAETSANTSSLQHALRDRIFIPETNYSTPSEETLRQVRHSFAGVRTQSRRIGILSSAVAVLLIIASLATMFAVIAEERRKIAVSRQLAMASRVAVEERQDVALLLSELAYQTADTFEARSSLLRAILHRPRLLGFMRSQSTTIQSGSRGGISSAIVDITFSDSGEQLRATTKDHKILSWSTSVPESMSHQSPSEDNETLRGRMLLSPTGRSVALSLKHTVVLLDAVTGKEITRLKHTFGRGKLTFSANGKSLALGTEDGVLLVWDMTLPQPVALQLLKSNETVGRAGVLGVIYPVITLQMSQDGRFLMSQNSKERVAQIWDLRQYQSGKKPAPVLLQPVTGRVTQVAFHPNGNTLIARMGSGALQKFDVRTGQPINDKFGQTALEMSSPVDLEMHPNGQWLATGSRDGIVTLWDLRYRQAKQYPLSGHRGTVTSLAFSKDGTRLVSGSSDHSVMLWDTSQLDALANSNSTIVSTLNKVLGSEFVDSVTFSPDGVLVAGASQDDAMLWNESNGKIIARLSHAEITIRSLSISPDGTTLATGGNGEKLLFWDLMSRQPLGEPIRTNPRRGSWLSRLAFSPDGSRLVAATSGGGLFIFDSLARKQQGKPLRKGSSNLQEITQLSFISGGHLLAIGSDNIETLWDLSKRETVSPALQGVPSRAVAVSADGQMLAASSVDGIVLWDIATRKRIGQLEISSIELAFEDDKTTSLAFSNDGKILAAGREDGRIQLWDIKTRQPLGPPLRTGRGGRSSQSPSGTPSLAFRPDSLVLAAGGFGLSLWDVDPENWARIAHRMANRSLTKDELKHYLREY